MVRLTDGTEIDLSGAMADITNSVIRQICYVADTENLDRDDVLKYFARLIGAFSEVSTIRSYED